MWNLAQDLPIDPISIGESLGKAQNVQQVLATVVGVLLLAIIAIVIFHVREARRWEDKYEKRINKNDRTTSQIKDALVALAAKAEDEVEE